MWTCRIPSSSRAVTSIIRLSLILVPLCAARFPIDKWECGSGDWSRSHTHQEVMRSCPHFAEEINHCCVVHDDCYGRQKGQALCDKQFDACNKKVLEDERAGACRTIVETAYEVLEVLGWFAYGSSYNYTEPHESELDLCRPNRTMGVFFDYMYLSCPTMKKSISSCCQQLNLCPENPLGRNRTECANRAMQCLQTARAEEHHFFNEGHCDRALNRTRKYLALDYIMDGAPAKLRGPPEMFAKSNQAFLLLLCLSMLCGVGLLLVTYKYYRLRTENKNRKYSTITLSTA